MLSECIIVGREEPVYKRRGIVVNGLEAVGSAFESYLSFLNEKKTESNQDVYLTKEKLLEEIKKEENLKNPLVFDTCYWKEYGLENQPTVDIQVNKRNDNHYVISFSEEEEEFAEKQGYEQCIENVCLKYDIKPDKQNSLSSEWNQVIGNYYKIAINPDSTVVLKRNLTAIYGDTEFSLELSLTTGKNSNGNIECGETKPQIELGLNIGKSYATTEFGEYHLFREKEFENLESFRKLLDDNPIETIEQIIQDFDENKSRDLSEPYQTD